MRDAVRESRPIETHFLFNKSRLPAIFIFVLTVHFFTKLIVRTSIVQKSVERITCERATLGVGNENGL